MLRAPAPEIYFVTCSEPDATPFLTALPVSVQERALLVATGDVVRSAEHRTRIPRTFVIGGPSTVEETRRLLAEPGAHRTVVVGPDPWGPVHGKGFVRARLMAPLVVSSGPVDIIELEAGGESGRIRRGLDRSTLSRWLRRRETALLVQYVLWGSAEQGGRLARPLVAALRGARTVLVPFRVAATLAVVVPYALKSEFRARRL